MSVEHVPACPGGCGAAAWRLTVRTSELRSGVLLAGKPVHVGPPLRSTGLSATCSVCGFVPAARSRVLAQIQEAAGV